MVWNWRDSLTKNSTPTVQVDTLSTENISTNTEIPLLNALQTPACIVNSQLNLIAANAEMRSQWPQLKLNELVTLHIRNPLFLEALNDVRTHNISKEVTFTKKQEFDRILQCQISPITRDDTPNILILFRDLTAATKIEQMRVDFVANASHELKTPIAAILGFIETLQGPAKNDVKATEKFLGIMHTQAKRMARLVDDLLSLSRMELLEHVPVQDVVNVSDVLIEVVDSLNALAANAKITLRVHNTSHNANVLGDKDALFRMAENIISNAIKYGEGGEAHTLSLDGRGSHEMGGEGIILNAGEGSILDSSAMLQKNTHPHPSAALTPSPIKGEGRVDITLTNPDENHLILTIQDYGIGISKDHLPRLTERFYRVDEARSREKGGTGLGLAIVKHCINRHKGTLKFESELGKGMTVEISLPVI